jgi:hypothetical protein
MSKSLFLEAADNWNGVECGIWDYKGARWSAGGPNEIFRELFGKNFYK